MKVTEEAIQKAAESVKLNISETETKNMVKDMDAIINVIQTMNQLDTKDVEPMSQALPVKNVFREDIALNSDLREEVLKNAPRQEKGCFQVPKTIE